MGPGITERRRVRSLATPAKVGKQPCGLGGLAQANGDGLGLFGELQGSLSLFRFPSIDLSFWSFCHFASRSTGITRWMVPSNCSKSPRACVWKCSLRHGLGRVETCPRTAQGALPLYTQRPGSEPRLGGAMRLITAGFMSASPDARVRISFRYLGVCGGLFPLHRRMTAGTNRCVRSDHHGWRRPPWDRRYQTHSANRLRTPHGRVISRWSPKP